MATKEKPTRRRRETLRPPELLAWSSGASIAKTSGITKYASAFFGVDAASIHVPSAPARTHELEPCCHPYLTAERTNSNTSAVW